MIVIAISEEIKKCNKLIEYYRPDATKCTLELKTNVSFTYRNIKLQGNRKLKR